MKLLLVFSREVTHKEGEYDKIIHCDVRDLAHEETKDLNSSLVLYLQDYISKEINDKHLIDSFKVNKVSNHWFYHRFMLYHNLRKGYYEIKIIDKYRKDYSKINVLSNRLDSSWFTGDEKIKIFKTKEKRKKRNYFILLVSILKFLIITSYRILISRKIGLFSSTQDINFIHGKNKLILNQLIKENFYTNTDNFWGVLYENNKDLFTPIEELDLLKLIKTGKLIFLKKYFTKHYKNSFYSEYIYFSAFFKIKTLNNIFLEFKKIKKYNNYIDTHSENEIEKMISSYVKTKKLASYIYSFKHNAYSSFFSNFSNKSSILVYTENDAFGKVLIDAGKLNNFSTYAIQHGIVNKYNYAYNYSEFEQSKNNIPNKTFLWGEINKRFLINESYYNEKQIIVSGHVRSDIVSTFKKHDSYEKIIVFFSQPQPYLKARYYETEMLISAISKFTKLKLIIKLHPREKDDIFSNLIKKYNTQNIIIDTKTDIYTLINKSSLCITCYSTVGIEALYFGKTLIALDSMKTDLAGFNQNKIAYSVSKEYELFELLIKYENNELKQNKQVENYLNEYSKLDGQCSNRIVEEISQT